MSKIDIEKLRLKRGPGRPPLPEGEVMRQISIRLPAWMFDEADAIIEHERGGEGDIATILREMIRKGFAAHKES